MTVSLGKFQISLENIKWYDHVQFYIISHTKLYSGSLVAYINTRIGCYIIYIHEMIGIKPIKLNYLFRWDEFSASIIFVKSVMVLKRWIWKKTRFILKTECSRKMKGGISLRRKIIDVDRNYSVVSKRRKLLKNDSYPRTLRP